MNVKERSFYVIFLLLMYDVYVIKLCLHQYMVVVVVVVILVERVKRK
jgi:hypothetical protein